jgi:hypothetical protein
MAKAVVPMRAFRSKYGDLNGDQISVKLRELVEDFLLHDGTKEAKTQVLSS